jgi:hypothetical protein
MLITFFVGILLQLFQQIQNQHQILRFLYLYRNNFKKILFWVILAPFANFEAERVQNGPENEKSFFQT